MATVRRSIEVLRSNNINIKEAYLFGSYAAGSEHDWSDIDIALISDDFSEDRYRERIRVMKITSEIDNRIEPVPYNSTQFTDLDPLVWEIKNHGIAIRTN
ncbi:MAG TPA: nucleotidyltransferase domain-containing protein [Spirochaetota bacterium]|nr:nucleotidyltransferase domain-containing protein [Spirochaetota bacterium]